MLPLHFASGAARRYQYQPRSVAWIRRKFKLMQRGKAISTDPLLFTGQLRQWVLGSARVKATPKGCRISAETPRYVQINYRPPRPNMAAEITRLIHEEREELIAFGEGEMDYAAADEPQKPEKIDVSVGAYYHG